MKQYELTVLIHPDLEMNLTPALDKIKKLIESHDGKIVKKKTMPSTMPLIWNFQPRLQPRFLLLLISPRKSYVIS